MGALEHGFDENQLREFFTDGEAGVANLADEIVSTGHQFDDLIFAKTNFTKAILDFRRGAQLFDPHRNAALNAA